MEFKLDYHNRFYRIESQSLLVVSASKMVFLPSKANRFCRFGSYTQSITQSGKNTLAKLYEPARLQRRKISNNYLQMVRKHKSVEISNCTYR